MKGARFVIGFLLFATVISVAAMLLLYVVMTQEPRVPLHATLVLSPSGDLPEVLPEFAFGAGDELTVRAYVELIRKAKNDARIDGILLRPGGINSPFWAKLQELREAIDDFKSSGKKPAEKKADLKGEGKAEAKTEAKTETKTKPETKKASAPATTD